MSRHVNSASRIRHLLISIPYHQDNTQVLSVWASLFNIQESNVNKQSLIVAERLSLLYRELDTARLQMAASNFSPEYYGAAFNSVEQALSAMQLVNSWPQVRQHLTDQTFTVLGLCSEIIPDEESLVDEPELEKLKNLVSELEEYLTSSQLPAALQAVMKNYVELIQKALSEYPITGIRALRDANRTAIGEILEVQGEINENFAKFGTKLALSQILRLRLIQ